MITIDQTPPPRHIAFVNHSSLISDKDIAFQAAAIEIQLRDHVAPLWDGEPPGVSFIGYSENIPPGWAAMLGYVDDDGNAESAGYHTVAGDFVWGLVDIGQSNQPSLSASHEALEMYGNAKLMRRVPGPNGLEYFCELGDPVEAQTYKISVTIFGETREVVVSDFILPAWLGLPNALARDTRTTYLNQPLKAFEVAPGGYQIAQDKDGNTVYPVRPTNKRSKYARASRLDNRHVVLPR